MCWHDGNNDMSTALFTSGQAAAAINARHLGDAASTVLRVNTDSRNVLPGDLFVAIKGERFDGHDFVAAALRQGAVAALVSADFAADELELGADKSLLQVQDSVLGLGQLAAWWRSRFDLPLVGVTGSNGKTTVKEMLASILTQRFGAAAVLATIGNLNNHIGLPLMLLQLNQHHRCAVLEMGMNHFDEIRYLTGLAKPDVALVNNAGSAHLEHLGSIAGVAQAKGEIFDGLAAHGVAIINADDTFVGYWRGLNSGRRVLCFGLEDADVYARSIEVLPLTSQFELVSPAGCVAVQLNIPGQHNVRNALAAATAALALDVPLADIAQGLASYTGTKGRLQAKRAASGALLIDDTYNANPDSMKAAVDVLTLLPEPRILVLGDMAEVGTEAAQRHADLGFYAKQVGITQLWATGDAMRQAVERFGEGAHWFEDHATLAAALRPSLTPDATALFKGSRFMAMEQVLQAVSATDKGAL